MSCTSATDCTAVGVDLVNGDPFYVTESSGTWGAVTEISTPAGDGFNSVSCTSATDCTAVGENSSGPFYTTESAGMWGSATNLPDAGGGGQLWGVRCTSATDCTAVGEDNNGLSYVTESGGTWGSVTDIADTSADAAGNGGLNQVSCTSATDCTAVGYDSNGEPIYTSTVVAGGGSVAHLSVTPSPLPATPGPVTYTVTVSGAGPTPTGSVNIADNQGGTCSINPLVSGSGSCAITESASLSPYTVTATYSGDSNYNSAIATASLTASGCGPGSSCTDTVQSPSQTVTATGTTGLGTAAVALTVAPEALSCGVAFNYVAPVTTLTDTGLKAGTSVAVTDTVHNLPSKKGILICYQPLVANPPAPVFVARCHGAHFVAPCYKSVAEVSGSVVATLELPAGDPRFHIGGETPSVTSYSPASAKAGKKLTIKGANLSEVTGVTIGGVAAHITKTAPTSVKVTVPAGAKGGVVTVSSLAGVATGPSVTVSGARISPHPANLKRDEHHRR
ncbi:MAG TPA: Ig-like domain repeat protein [Acidimicrobiales bacterium]